MSDTSTISLDEINLESRPVELVVYALGTTTESHTIWLRPTSTYGDVSEQLADWDETNSVTLLQGNYGPIPRWTESQPRTLVADTCRILYAISGTETTHYILGVVRTSELDYPIPIYDLTQSPTITVSQAIVEAHPDLAGRIKSITKYGGSELAEDTYYGHEVALTSNESPGVQTLFIITVSEPPANFQVELVEGSIPSFLRIPYVHCKHLLRQAYALDVFSMQMIHLSSAMLHLICSLAADLQPTVDKTVAEMMPLYSAESKMAKILSVAPLLAQELQSILDSMEKIVGRLEMGGINQEEIRSEISKSFTTLCKDYPGATVVRHSYRRFKKMASIDSEEILQFNEEKLTHAAGASRSLPSASRYVPHTSIDAGRNQEQQAQALEAGRSLPSTSRHIPPISQSVPLASQPGPQPSRYVPHTSTDAGRTQKQRAQAPEAGRSLPSTSRHVPPISQSIPPASQPGPQPSLFATQIPGMAQTPPFIQLANIPGMGTGFRALRDIPRGTLVLQEAPTILLPANLLQQQRDATIEHYVQHLPAAVHQKISALQISHRFGVYAPNVARFLTNALPCEDNINAAGLFLSGARFNSSCTPNVHQHWNGKHMEFRAMVDIPYGHELFICYNIRDLLFPGSERRQKIETSCGFECRCPRCLEQSCESDDRRLRIGAALRITNHGDPRSVLHNINMIVGALKDLRQEGLHHYRDTLLYDGHQVCATAGDGNNAMLWLRRAYEAAVVVVGEQDPLVHGTRGRLANITAEQIYFSNWVQLLPPPPE